MDDAQTPLLHLARARERFFGEGEDPDDRIAPHISRSWRRCRTFGRASNEPEPITLQQLKGRREQSMRLLECAQPELEGLAEHALGNGCVVILSDASGLILDELGSADFLPKAQRVALTPGVEWSEDSRGTNAIGTALRERQALMVLGGEHYLPQYGGLGCAAAPIFTGRGEIAGALDISGEAVHVNSHALGLIRMAAQQVEHRMMIADAAGRHDLLRFHHRHSLLGTPREGLVVIDEGRIVAANRIALAFLAQAWEGLLDRSVEHLLGMDWSRLQEKTSLLRLPGGLPFAVAFERARPASRPSIAAGAPQAATSRVTDDTLPFLTRATRVLNQGVPVLVTGETGSGKEVFARRLHRESRRSAGPFVAVNCAALPETLIEAELFGYEEGAFTGARRRGMPGRIREAHGGILFLDEIGDMPPALQTRLLRVLEERVVTPLGGRHGFVVEFDLVCATHCDLGALVESGRFRSDLLYRVNGFSVALPGLRDRQDRDDLIKRLFRELGGDARRLSLAQSAAERLRAYAWPGNVRELCSVLRSVIALADDGAAIGAEQLSMVLPDARVFAHQAAPMAASHVSDGPLSAVAREAMDRALDECSGNVSKAARRLGVHRSTLYRHLANRRETLVDAAAPAAH